MSDNEVVLQAHAPGLGDWSIYTRMAALLTEAGYRVFISTLPIPGHGCAFRNDEVRTLLWECNPYIRGFVEKEPTLPHCFVNQKFIKLAKNIGTMRAVEKFYGLSPGIPGEKVPSIFYKPKLLPEWQDIVICDPSSISQPVAGQVFEEYMQWTKRWHDLQKNRFVHLKSRHSGVTGMGTLQNVSTHQVRDIFEYADIIYSAKAALFTEAGGHCLSAGIRPTGTFSCITTMAYNDRLFVFPEEVVQYYVTGRLTPDFHFYPETD